MIYDPLVIFLKRTPDKDNNILLTRGHIMMQSTSTKNLSTVKYLNYLSNYVEKRYTRRGKNKHVMGIELNESGKCYMKIYSIINTFDHMIKT